MSAHTVTEYAIQWTLNGRPHISTHITTDPGDEGHRDTLTDPDLAQYKPVRVQRTVTYTDWTEVQA